MHVWLYVCAYNFARVHMAMINEFNKPFLLRKKMTEFNGMSTPLVLYCTKRLDKWVHI